jgi:hypothetical protein
MNNKIKKKKAVVHMPVILALGGLRQENCDFKASLGCITRFCNTPQLRNFKIVTAWH